MRRATLTEIEPSVTSIESLLAAGQAVVLGISLWEQFFTDHGGELQTPSSDQLIPGGHAVVAVGFDADEGWLLIRNSWGESWGEDGHARLPIDSLETVLLGCWKVEDDIDD